MIQDDHDLLIKLAAEMQALNALTEHRFDELERRLDSVEALAHIEHARKPSKLETVNPWAGIAGFIAALIAALIVALREVF